MSCSSGLLTLRNDVGHLGAVEGDLEVGVVLEAVDAVHPLADDCGHDVVVAGLEPVEGGGLVGDEQPRHVGEVRLVAPVVVEPRHREAGVGLVLTEHVRAGADHLGLGVVVLEEVLRHDVAGRHAHLLDERGARVLERDHHGAGVGRFDRGDVAVDGAELAQRRLGVLVHRVDDVGRIEVGAVVELRLADVEGDGEAVIADLVRLRQHRDDRAVGQVLEQRLLDVVERRERADRIGAHLPVVPALRLLRNGDRERRAPLVGSGAPTERSRCRRRPCRQRAGRRSSRAHGLSCVVGWSGTSMAGTQSCLP